MYTGVFATLTLLGLVIRKGRLEFFAMLMSFAFLLFFMGTRYEVGCDFGGYLYRYETMPYYGSLLETLTETEPGFQFIIVGLVMNGIDYMWLNIICSAIMLAGYWYFLRHHTNPLLILALLFPVVILQLGMSGLRQGIAVSLLMAASVPFMNGKKIWTAVVILVAAQFHASAAMFLPLALLAGVRVTLTQLTYAGFALLPFAIWLLWDRLEIYQVRYVDEAYGDQTAQGAVFRYLLILPPAVLFFMFKDRIKEEYPRQFELLKIFSLLIISIAPLVVLSSFALQRINHYLMPFSIVTFVYVASVLFKKRDLPIALMIPPLVYGVYTIGWQSLSGHFQNCYQPYQSYLFL